jgi:hypothetical protein
MARTLEERRQALELEQAPFAARTLVPSESVTTRPIAQDRLAAIRKGAQELAARARTASLTDREAIERRVQNYCWRFRTGGRQSDRRVYVCQRRKGQKAPKKRKPPEDFSQTAIRIVREAANLNTHVAE